MTTNSLNAFKTQVQHLLKPIGWEPSEAQLQAFAVDYAARNPTSEREAIEVFSRHFSSVSFIDLQGLDNSDYRALLSLAIANASPVATAKASSSSNASNSTNASITHTTAKPTPR
ncbi:hypothetical protein [Pseudomonas syringae]|uniref:hypothetical protein n=1 Tax=Pseudomonas syringae TaxID=317 RepID=UPI00070DA3F0|nr:hypothetical protein [Pseudomonas syringae]KWS33229.1 hypothetical protein AL060_05240 [Pseudomonas syringae pv. rhaphiolepidis]